MVVQVTTKRKMDETHRLKAKPSILPEMQGLAGAARAVIGNKLQGLASGRETGDVSERVHVLWQRIEFFSEGGPLHAILEVAHDLEDSFSQAS